MSRGLDKIKHEILLRWATGEQSPEEKENVKKHAAGLSGIPVKKMIDQAIYIDEELLPKIKKKGGEKSADYIFFQEVKENLLYAIMLADRHDHLWLRNTQLKVSHQIALENIAILEGELQKYTTLEDLFYSDALDKYADVIKKRAAELLKKK